jgi:signal peptidase I
MDIDFSLVLVCLVGACGVVWLIDSRFIKKHRLQAIADFEATQAKGKSEDEVSLTVAGLSQEPIIVEYAKSFFPVLLIVLVLRSFLVEPFQIPTGSMIPTLEVGDFILVNKYAYGVRLPVLGTKLVDVADPERGDVMVFIPPHVNSYYIKRVIGLPGDTIRYEDKRLFVNGELIGEEFVEDIVIDTNLGELAGTLHQETINGVEHATQHISGVNRQRSRTIWVIPNGHYFMMGDNRDNSSDSREWGAVSEKDIVGRAIAVWMHKEPGLNLPSFARNQRIK